ncbi:MAG: ComF family protein [Prevotellaceae bacterium]|jgi:ComF family protein|nr:ComF family protein [Prevotellaceae bacterium]
MQNIFSALLSIFYPNTCATCGDLLEKHEKCICLKCLYHLPKTNLHLQKDNELEQRFWGKVPIFRVAAFFYFEKGSPFQKLLHHLKYKGEKEIGIMLGEYMGVDLRQSADFAAVDVVVPVPLHRNKMKTRGYNQSELLAKGIAAKLQKPLDTDTLFRAIENPTQTKKGVLERWENVEGIFCVKNKETFADKHILLVDDVLTTGATIAACAAALLQCENAKVSVASLAAA